MKNKTLTNALKCIVLAISWLTLSPLLLIMDGRWKLLPKWLRIVLFVVSPMMIAALWSMLLLGSYLTEIRWSVLSERLYDEVFEYQCKGTRLRRLRVLTDEEINALIADLKEQPNDQIELYKYAYKIYWPSSNWIYDNDLSFERDDIIAFLEESRRMDCAGRIKGDNDCKVFAVKHARCNHCLRKKVVLLDYSTPLWTWQHLCGRGGSILYCAHCNKMLCEEWFIMN